MGKAILAAIVTIISGYYGAIIGDELLNGFVQLGTIIAVAVMGAFIICFNDKKE